jgi:hypothetical protein
LQGGGSSSGRLGAITHFNGAWWRTLADQSVGKNDRCRTAEHLLSQVAVAGGDGDRKCTH